LQLAGSSRGQVESEFEKLQLYCWPSQTIALADVEASCGEQASFDVDVLSAAMLDGDVETADRVFQSIRADGDWRQVLIVLQMQFARLEGIKADMAGGGDMDRAFRSAKPPVFFGQQKAMARHLRTFALEDINQFGMALQAAVLASRQHGDLAEAVASRAILSLARRAKQLRQQR
jgi:DNA polymerase III subunit delta